MTADVFSNEETPMSITFTGASNLVMLWRAPDVQGLYHDLKHLVPPSHKTSGQTHRKSVSAALSLPVTKASGQHYNGFRPDRTALRKTPCGWPTVNLRLKGQAGFVLFVKFSVTAPFLAGVYDLVMPKSYVYFIQECPDGAIKIGCARNVCKRFKGLETGNPRELRFLLAIECDSKKQAFDLELYLHNKLRRDHILGEWFHARCFGMAKMILNDVKGKRIKGLDYWDSDMYDSPDKTTWKRLRAYQLPPNIKLRILRKRN